jgi:hypothetical protein
MRYRRMGRASGLTRVAIVAAACAIAGCRDAPPAAPPEPAADGFGPTRQAAEPLPDADINASLDLGVPAEPAADEAPRRFVGRWAVDQRSCATAAWRFTESELNTPAGSVCRFDAVRSVPGGFDVAARCTAEAPERDDLLRLRFPESAGGMLFESESIADVGLVRCGE